MENLSLQYPCLLKEAIIEVEQSPNTKFDFLLNHILSAPNLRSATCFYQNRMSFDEFAPSWGNLQELSIELLSPSLLISALASCQNLKRLSTSITRTAHRGNFRPVTLPQFTYLSVSMEMCPSFFDNLLVPSLDEVDIQNVEGPAWGHLICLLERSAIMIRVLTLDQYLWNYEEPDILHALGTSVFREVRVLYIKYPAGMKTVKFLTLPRCSNCESGGMQEEHDCDSKIANLPHLRKLELLLYCVPEDPEKSVAMSRLVESRLETMSSCVRDWHMVTVKLCLSSPTFVD